jgi:very-short-patch-repair endonuclease
VTAAAQLFSTALRPAETAELVLAVPAGAIVALAGIDPVTLRALVDEAEPRPDGRRVLFAPLAPARTPDALVEQITGFLAETARRLWPLWFTDVSFAACADDTLGRMAAEVIARRAADDIPGLLRPWVEPAARRALAGRLPRVDGTPPATEIAQLARAISRTGLVLVVDATAASAHGEALVRALEWTAQAAQSPVVALFREPPANTPPLDRLLYGARTVAIERDVGWPDGTVEDEAAPGPWLAPIRGMPHPLSDIEQRLAKMLDADRELAPLFCFNRTIETVRGSAPRVDLVWLDGRLVVELDGYPDHGTRTAFTRDRHRDYELTLSGYTVLRLANDEIVQDFGKAIDKIRDMVKLCRSRRGVEG